MSDALGTLQSGVNSLLNSIQTSNQMNLSKKQQQMAIDAQKEENEKDRAYNAEQAKLQREFQLSSYELARDDSYSYNDPSAVMGRLAKAGINPAMYYEGAGTGIVQANVGTGSAATSSAHGIADYDMSNRAMQAVSANMLNMQKAMAEIANLNADTKSTEIDNDFKPFFNTKELTFLDGKINLQLTEIVKNEAEARNLAILNDELQERVTQLRAHNAVYASSEAITAATDILMANADMKKEEANMFAEYMSAKIANLCGQTNEFTARAAELSQKARELKAQIDAKEDANYYEREVASAITILEHDAGIAEAQSYRESTTYQVAKEGVEAIIDIADAIFDAKGKMADVKEGAAQQLVNQKNADTNAKNADTRRMEANERAYHNRWKRGRRR